MENEKTGQQINNEIPMEIWDDFEDLFMIEKRKDPSRKLNKKDFFVAIFRKGVESWVK